MKTGLWRATLANKDSAKISSDFAENIIITRKHETAGKKDHINMFIFHLLDQHFHKLEILLFRSVSTLVTEDDTGVHKAQDISHVITSDYR